MKHSSAPEYLERGESKDELLREKLNILPIGPSTREIRHMMNWKNGFFALALALAACGPTAADQSGRPTTPTTTTCPAGQALCDGACTNLRIDADNCGACGRSCTDGQTCVRGVCRGETTNPPPPVTCTAPAANCDGNDGNGCEANTQTDSTNCGSCGARCNAGFACTAGRCTPNAPTGPVCGNGRCENGESCSTCSADCGACAPTCSTGTANCDGNAANGCETNTNLDVNNCGACGARCNGVCLSGSCVAQPTGPRCGDGVCNGTETCSSCAGDCGACAPTCTGTGMMVCGGRCVNTLMDNANCGACGANCAAVGWVCSAGRCVDPMPRACSSPGQGYCAGVCRDLYTDSTNCGACGRTCASGTACVMGACIASSMGLETFRTWYRTPSGVTVTAIGIYQFADHNPTPGYLQPPCAVAGGASGAYTGHTCSLQARVPMGLIVVNTQVQLSAAETARMGGRTTTWACAVYASGGPMELYGTMGVEWHDRSLTLTPVSNGRDGCNFQAPVY